VKSLSDLRVRVFADGADPATILELYANPLIAGFTTNPTLMRKAGIRDYRGFAREVLELVPDRPVSFEVFADDFVEMEEQALEIASWGDNVFVKIPVTNCRSESCEDLLRRLTGSDVQVNVTALMTVAQVERVAASLEDARAGFVSLFAGRIADTGRDPVPYIEQAVEVLDAYPQLELIWASPRELLNLFQADAAGCHVVTVTNDILRKLDSVGRNLDEFSLETVKMFHDDAAAAGYTLARELVAPD
jgi:transaldolase